MHHAHGPPLSLGGHLCRLHQLQKVYPLQLLLRATHGIPHDRSYCERNLLQFAYGSSRNLPFKRLDHHEIRFVKALRCSHRPYFLPCNCIRYLHFVAVGDDSEFNPEQHEHD